MLMVESALSSGPPADPERWPLSSAVSSRLPVLVDDLRVRFGELVYEPWPEPVSRGYVLPLNLPGPDIDAVLVFGVSPRLPFDESYETFSQLVGARIASLLQGEIHKRELAEAAKNIQHARGSEPLRYGDRGNFAASCIL